MSYRNKTQGWKCSWKGENNKSWFWKHKPSSDSFLKFILIIFFLNILNQWIIELVNFILTNYYITYKHDYFAQLRSRKDPQTRPNQRFRSSLPSPQLVCRCRKSLIQKISEKISNRLQMFQQVYRDDYKEQVSLMT